MNVIVLNLLNFHFHQNAMIDSLSHNLCLYWHNNIHRNVGMYYTFQYLCLSYIHTSCVALYLSRPLHPSVFEVLILKTNLDQANNLY